MTVNIWKQSFNIKSAYYITTLTILIIGLQVSFFPIKTQAITRNIVFPVLGGGWFQNDYLSPRTLNGVHHATDIFAPKHTPLVAAVDGWISFMPMPQPSYGWMLSITDAEGFEYNYIHINNDNPGTDDGGGGPMHAFAPDMKYGQKVVKGQHIGYLGDSGNAESTPPHLHFEIYDFNGNPINPYESLPQAPRLSTPAKYPPLPGELLPYDQLFSGAVNTTAANLDSDDEKELVVAVGGGGSPHVVLFDDDLKSLNRSFYAYSTKFYGGVDVAAGDVDGDGIDEIITGAGFGGGPHVRVFKNNQPVKEFFAYNKSFTGGIKVAAGDVDGDGKAEIITGAGPGGGPHVIVFNADGTVKNGFFAYNKSFTGGVDVAAGDVDGDGKAEIITGAGPGGGPHVIVFNADGTVKNGFFAYGNSFPGGVRVNVGNVLTGTSEMEIVTVPASRGGPQVRAFKGDGEFIKDTMYLESWWEGGYDAAVSENKILVGTGPGRRASVRQANLKIR